MIELTGVTGGGNGTGRARRTREDALPEFARYRDDGCDLFVSCLACPLPRCRYDVRGGARTMLNAVRDVQIRRMRRDDGLPVDEIARRFRISRRTVFRAIRAGPSPATPGHTNE